MRISSSILWSHDWNPRFVVSVPLELFPIGVTSDLGWAAPCLEGGAFGGLL